MSWLFSRALVEAYSAASCLDGKPSAPSSLSHSVVSGLHSDKTKAFYRPSLFGAETSLFSTENHGGGLLTWFQAASLVRISAEPTLMLSEFPARVRVYGNKCSESFEKLDAPTFSWKTHKCSLDGGLELFSQTWPRWGMMQDGECWERTTLAVSITEKECSLWATPIERDYKDSPGMATQAGDRTRLDTLPRQVFAFWPTPVASQGGPNTNSKSVMELRHGKNLTGVVKFWPTPTVCGNYNRKGASQTSGNGLATEMQTAFGWTENSSSAKTEKSAPLNPDFAEWLMGWPIGWTGLAPLETGKFQQWLNSHGKS